jgi:hypothetical protein
MVAVGSFLSRSEVCVNDRDPGIAGKGVVAVLIFKTS